VHTGECEAIGDDIGGIAVHIAARVCALSGPAQVLGVAHRQGPRRGLGITFSDQGTHELKGVPDDWQLYAATG